MKKRLSFLILLSGMFVAVRATPATAGELYENGPINGQTDAWTINYGFDVSDTFTISTGDSTITGLQFGVWLSPGDVVQSVEILLSSQEDGGTIYFDQQVSLTQSGCALNSYNYDVCTETAVFDGPSLGNGRYWLNLMNAESVSGDPVYWDENSGVGCHSLGCPSSAGPGGEGTLPSEAFTILGNASSTGTTPEPATVILFGSGILASSGLLRRLRSR